VRHRRAEADRLGFVVALAHHVHRLADAYLGLVAKGMHFEALGLARACYETALRCQWMAVVEDAPEALLNEHERQRTALLKSSELGGWITDPDLLTELAKAGAEAYEVASNARSVEQMCEDLEGAGMSAYVLYRAMSSNCHPSAALADAYLDVDAAGTWIGFRQRAPWDARLGTFPVLVALIWAGKAVDERDPAHTRRSELRAAARRLGVPERLRLSDKAWLRLHPRPGS